MRKAPTAYFSNLIYKLKYPHTCSLNNHQTCYFCHNSQRKIQFYILPTKINAFFLVNSKCSPKFQKLNQ
jgi:hypothetical protein